MYCVMVMFVYEVVILLFRIIYMVNYYFKVECY